MGALRCVDGSVLTVVAVACSDRMGKPYEITLDLRRGRKPFASVGEREYFSLRSRDRSDLPGTGEFRCALRDSAEWVGGRGPAIQRGEGQPAGWRLTRRAVIEAWGADGIGLRAVLTSAELVTFLDTVLGEPDVAGATARASAGAQAARNKLAGVARSAWRQRGRVPDESARSRLPALRAQNRSVAFAAGDPQAR